MSTPVINETITALDPTQVSGSVRLWAEDGGGGVAYTNAGTPISIGGIIRISFNASGQLKADDGVTSLTLNPNSGSSSDAIVTPSGTAWQYEIRYPGTRGPEVRYLTVPDVAGPLQVLAILTDQPGSIASAGSKAYTDAAVAAIGTGITLAGDVTGTAAATSIASSAVTTAKIADTAVTTAKLASGVLSGITLTGDVSGTTGATAIGTGAVTTAKLAAGAATFGKLDPAVIGDALTGDASTLAVKLHEQRQDIPRRGGTVYRNRATSALQRDVIIGDSIAAGVGGLFFSTDWATRLANIENRALGLADIGGGMVMANGKRSGVGGDAVYGSSKFSDLGAGAAVADGMGLATAWKLNSNGAIFGDVQTCRMVVTTYRKVTSGATFQISYDGGSTWTTDVATAGTGLGIYVGADLGSSASRSIRYKQTSAGAGGVTIEGHEPLKTAGTAGVVVDCLGCGGTTTADWLADRTWESYLTALVAASTVPRRIFTSLAGNDMLTGVSASTTATNLGTIWARQLAASPLSQRVFMCCYYPSKPSAGKTGVGFSTWQSTWVPALRAAAVTAGVSFIDLTARFGDVSEGVDPYTLTMDGGLHFTPTDQAAIADVIVERFGVFRGGPSTLPRDGSLPMTGSLNLDSNSVTNLNGGTLSALGSSFTFSNGDQLFITKFNVFGTDFGLMGLGLTGDLYPRVAFTSPGSLGWGSGSATADFVISRLSAGVASMTASQLRTSADPSNDSDLSRKFYVDTGDTAAKARANHTGTQLANTVSNFDTQVRTSRIDQMAAPTSGLSWLSTTSITVGDGTSSDGSTAIFASTVGFPFTGIQITKTAGDTQAIARLLNVNGVGRLDLGTTGGSTAPGVNLVATGNAAATFTGVLTVTSAATFSGGLAAGSSKITALAAGTASTDAVAVSQLTGVAIATGRYTTIDHSSRTTLALTQNRAYAMRIIIAKATTFTSAGVEVVTTAAGAGGVCYVSLFAESAGQPTGSPVATSSSIAVTSTGYQEVTAQTMTIATPGAYWLVVHYNTSATVPTLRATAAPSLLSSNPGPDPSGTSVSAGVRSSSDTWTTTAPSWAGTAVIGTVPLAWLKS